MSKIPSVKLSGMDDLFGISGNISEIVEIPLEQCHNFKNHPFRVLDNEDMDNLVDSIKLNGRVLEPILVRSEGLESYEIISGHRRCAAARKCGFTTIPAIVRKYSDEEATVMMVDANLRRENLTYSEKAWAYRMKYDALKHQGKAGNISSIDSLAENGSESAKTIQRLIRLTYLMPELLELVDADRIPYLAGVDLSFLSLEEQEILYGELSPLQDLSYNKKIVIDGKKAAALKKSHNEGILSREDILAILYPEASSSTRSFKLKSDKIYNFFPKGTKDDEIEQLIFDLLEKWYSQNGKG